MLKKIPNIYFFIFKGFVIDLFFSNISMPYTISYTLIGLYLNFSNLKWIQRSLLEQIILITLVSLFLNILLFSTNDFASGMGVRIFINPLLNIFKGLSSKIAFAKIIGAISGLPLGPYTIKKRKPILLNPYN